MKYLFPKGHEINNGRIPWNKGKKGLQVAWNKGIKGVIKPNSGSFKKGRKPTQKWLETMRGRKPWNAGKRLPHLSGENSSRWKGGVSCLDCGKNIRQKEKKRCLGCYNVWRKIPENHPNWKGGITPLNHRIRTCFKYRQWRSDVFTRDYWTCVLCGKKQGIVIIADHYPKMFAEILKEYEIKTLEEALNCEEFWDINNGRTLCKTCHLKYGRKR